MKPRRKSITGDREMWKSVALETATFWNRHESFDASRGKSRVMDKLVESERSKRASSLWFLLQATDSRNGNTSEKKIIRNYKGSPRINKSRRTGAKGEVLRKLWWNSWRKSTSHYYWSFGSFGLGVEKLTKMEPKLGRRIYKVNTSIDSGDRDPTIRRGTKSKDAKLEARRRL